MSREYYRIQRKKLSKKPEDFPIVRTDKGTTKIRIVFDAYAKKDGKAPERSV